ALPKGFAQFAEAFACTFTGCVVSDAYGSGVTGIIAIGDDEVGVARALDEIVQKMIVSEGIALPEIVGIKSDGPALPSARDVAKRVAAPVGFARTGVVDVTDDRDLHRLQLYNGDRAIRKAEVALWRG